MKDSSGERRYTKWRSRGEHKGEDSIQKTLLLLLSLSITASPLLRDVYLFLFPSSPPLILRSKIEMRRLEDVEPVATTSLAVVLKLVGLLVRRTCRVFTLPGCSTLFFARRRPCDTAPFSRLRVFPKSSSLGTFSRYFFPFLVLTPVFFSFLPSWLRPKPSEVGFIHVRSERGGWKQSRAHRPSNLRSPKRDREETMGEQVGTNCGTRPSTKH